MNRLFIACAALGAMVLGAQAQTATRLNVSAAPCGEQNVEIVLPVDADGYIAIFDGLTLDGWRGYGKDHVPAGWTVENGCLKFTPGSEGGDIIFPHDFKDFDLQVEWMIDKGGNSGLFYLGQETVNADGNLEPLFLSAPEYQLLDNVNHPDSFLGVDGNRKSASLYDMLPAKPQNSVPWGQWNTARVVVKDGKVAHYQNGKKVLQYTIFTPAWNAMLNGSKFAEAAWPAAFKALSTPHDGFIGFQDHGNRVWLRNIKVKPL